MAAQNSSKPEMLVVTAKKRWESVSYQFFFREFGIPEFGREFERFGREKG